MFGTIELSRSSHHTPLRYSLGIAGVAGAVIGPHTVAEVAQNVEWAKRWKPLLPEERASLREEGKKLAAAWGPRFGPAARNSRVD